MKKEPLEPELMFQMEATIRDLWGGGGVGLAWHPA